MALVSMVLYSTNITTQTSLAFMPLPSLTLSQLPLYSTTVQYTRARLPPQLHIGTAKIGRHHCPCIWEFWFTQRPVNEPLWTILFNLGLCISYFMQHWTYMYLQNWGTRSAITMRWKRLSVLLNSRLACSLLQRLTISTTISVPGVHMTHSMELGYLSFNIQMMPLLEF